MKLTLNQLITLRGLVCSNPSDIEPTDFQHIINQIDMEIEAIEMDARACGEE